MDCEDDLCQNYENLYEFVKSYGQNTVGPFLPRDAYAQVRHMLACGVFPSVRPSVTFVDHVKTNKHIFEIFSPSVATPF